MCRAPTVAMFVLAACQSPEPSLSALWARWFSFRGIDHVTVSPDGERILIGGFDTRDIVIGGFADGGDIPYSTEGDAEFVELHGIGPACDDGTVIAAPRDARSAFATCL
jgi:hypothetical protein